MAGTSPVSQSPAAEPIQVTDSATPTAQADATQETQQGTGPAPQVEPKKKGNVRSKVWSDFVRISDKLAQCKHCNKKLKAGSRANGTSSMKTHLGTCPENPNKKLKGQQSLVFPPPRPGQSSQLVAVSYDKDMCRRRLVEFVIIDELPFRIVEGEGFRRYSEQLEPRFKVPSRMTIYRDLLVIYKDEKEKLKKYFKESKQRVSLTTDTWTSPNNFNYMCVTVHFIDNHWKLQKRIILFCQIKGHTGVDIGKTLERCLLDWGLEDLFGVTLDNVSANTVAIEYLQTSVINWTGATVRAEYMQVRCAAHVLALVVKDAVLLYHKSISRIRSVIKFVTGSPTRLAKFKECAALEKIDCKKMVFLDVKTRWNATYLMLEAAIPYEKVFKRLEREDKSFRDKYIFKESECEALPNPDDDTVVADEDYFLSSSESESEQDVTRKRNTKKKNKPRHHAPYAADWSYARSLVKCLKIFFDATVKFSASTQVTTHEFLWQLALIHEQLVRLRAIGNRDAHISRMAEVMFKKYNSYWGEYEDMNSVLFFAKLLDPREKESGLKFDLECLYEQQDYRVDTVLKAVKQDMGRLYEEYNTMYSNANADEGTGSTTVAGVDDMVVCVQEENIEDMLESRKKRRRMNVHSTQPKSELERYLLDDCETSTRDFDILAWWQTNSTKYKVLSLMAKDILAIPVSSVASESAFSTGKRILTPWRSSLSARTVEALLCTQSWLQKPISLDFMCDYVPDDNASIEDEILGKEED